MTEDEIEELARTLQAEVYPYGPERPSPPWEILSEGSKAFWRAKARAGVKAGQAAVEADAWRKARQAESFAEPPKRR